MTLSRTYHRSFNGGIIAPDGFGRFDDPKYQSGLEICRNFIPLPHGPAQNRTGFKFVRAAKNAAKKARLIPFSFSADQTMVLEFGEQYIRFHTQGATLESSPGVAYEIATPYMESDLPALKFAQSADVLTLVHPNHQTRELRRLGAVNWQLVTVSFASTLGVVPDVSCAANVPGGATNLQSYDYAVTAVAADGIDESLVSKNAASVTLVITGITNANPGVVTITSFTGLTVGQRVYVSGVGGMSQVNGQVYRIGKLNGTSYQHGQHLPALAVTTMTLVNEDGTELNTTGFGTYLSGGVLNVAGCVNNLFTTGAYNSIKWNPVAGAAYYNVYKLSSGVFGFIGQTTFTSFRDDNISANIAKTPPLASDPFVGAGNYPGAVSYFEQRRCFAGTTLQPQNVWMTRSGTESNMNYSIPSREDDAISIRVSAREANVIRHLVPMQNLIAFTDAAEWRITSVNSDAVTPTSISVRPQSYVGANDARPVIVNNTVIYGASRGGHVREMSYDWQASGYVTGDLSLRAPNLFDNLTIQELAYSKAPVPIVWALSSNGELRSLTYVPEQQVGAWATHTTDGSYESIAVVSEGDEDILYAVVRRTINGATVRYVERKSEQLLESLTEAFYVDCGATYRGAPATTISGLPWLNGKTVSVLADGAVQSQRTVVGGSITLEEPASVVHVGLPIDAEVRTLPMAFDVPGAGQGRPKNVNKVWLRVHRSSGVFVGPDPDHLTEAKIRTTELMGLPPALQSAELEVQITPKWQDGGQVVVQQEYPLPLTLVSLTAEVSIGG